MYTKTNDHNKSTQAFQNNVSGEQCDPSVFQLCNNPGYDQCALEGTKTRNRIVSAVFEKQPPDNLRKSNFFNFDLSFFNENGLTVGIEKASFVGFLEHTEEEKQLKNGIRYKLLIKSPGSDETEEITVQVRLVDSVSKKFISYDGQDKNPDMCRVLLTHEVMCSRCCENKSCGNRNETPSDPVLLTGGTGVKFHMKCNQNCLKNAGNPRETRRFKVIILLEEMGRVKNIGLSENIFVHNNSKHGRKNCVSNENFLNSLDVNSPPSILFIVPREGKVSGYEEIVIIGECFHEDIKIAFGNKFAIKTERINSTVLRVITPPFYGENPVEIKCVCSSHIFQRGKEVLFKYYDSSKITESDHYYDRLWNVIPKNQHEYERPPNESILKRCAEMLEYMYMVNVTTQPNPISSNAPIFVPNSNYSDTDVVDPNPGFASNYHRSSYHFDANYKNKRAVNTDFELASASDQNPSQRDHNILISSTTQSEDTGYNGSIYPPSISNNSSSIKPINDDGGLMNSNNPPLRSQFYSTYGNPLYFEQYNGYNDYSKK